MATWCSGALACAWLSTLLWKGPLLTGDKAHPPCSLSTLRRRVQCTPPSPDKCDGECCWVGALHLVLLSVIWQVEGYVSAMCIEICEGLH